MRRLWIGVAFLAVLLVGSVFLLVFSGRFYRDFAAALEEAADFAMEENWVSATEKARKCQEKWEKNQHFLAAFTDHEPVEQVQLLFSQLTLYGEKRMSVEFASVCQQLRHCAEAIDESHSLKWWTVL